MLLLLMSKDSIECLDPRMRCARLDEDSKLVQDICELAEYGLVCEPQVSKGLL